MKGAVVARFIAATLDSVTGLSGPSLWVSVASQTVPLRRVLQGGQLVATYPDAAVTPANTDDRAAISTLIEVIQDVTGENIDLTYLDQSYTGEQPAQAAVAHDIALEVAKQHEAEGGFVLLLRRWQVQRSFGWFAGFRRVAHDYRRMPETLAGLHLLALTILLPKQACPIARNTEAEERPCPVLTTRG